MPSKTKEINEEKFKKNVTSKDVQKKTTKSKSTAKKSSVKTNLVATDSKNKTTAKAKKSSVAKKTVAKKPVVNKSVKKKTTSKKEKKVTPLAEVVEYYDLPYRYNQTVIKLLAQTPTTLFIYWDISDKDRKTFEEQYGETFSMKLDLF